MKKAPVRNDVLMISFSGGRTSAYMTTRLLAEQPDRTTVICFANTGKEEPATLDFVDQCDRLWGGQVVWLEFDPVDKFKIVSYQTASRRGEPFAALIQQRKYLPNVVARFCTQDLKVRIMKRYMQSLGYQHWTSAIGIRFDEQRRWAKVENSCARECYDAWLPLVDWKITKPMVLAYWQQMPFDLQLKEYEGNCDMCFLKGKHKLKRIISEHPEKAQWWIAQEQATGGTFHKNHSVQQLVELVRTQPSLFDQAEGDIDCFCNID